MKIEKGMHGRREVNHVDYDPEQVTLEQLEGWLQEAGTWDRTLVPSKRGRE